MILFIETLSCKAYINTIKISRLQKTQTGGQVHEDLC